MFKKLFVESKITKKTLIIRPHKVFERYFSIFKSRLLIKIFGFRDEKVQIIIKRTDLKKQSESLLISKINEENLTRFAIDTIFLLHILTNRNFSESKRIENTEKREISEIRKSGAYSPKI